MGKNLFFKGPEDVADHISKDEALTRLFEAWQPQRKTETVELADSCGRVLAEDLQAMYNIPAVRASGMDGIAFNFDLIKNGTDPAGWRAGREYTRADTGDDFDDAYDTVVKIEDVTITPDGGIVFAPDLEIRRGMNIRGAGSMIRKGSPVASKGMALTAADLAAIGMGGYAKVKVVTKPKVAFLPTGSELVPAGSKLQRGQNFETNSIMVGQLLKEMGAEPVIYPLVKDDIGAMTETFDRMIEESDIVIINAGSSKGSEDFGRKFVENGDVFLFHSVLAAPGRPLSMAIVKGKPVINMPGPAAAAFYVSEWAVKAAVGRFFGIKPAERETIEAVLTADLRMTPFMSLMKKLHITKKDGVYYAEPADRETSGAAASLTAAGMYINSYGEQGYSEGDKIKVQIIRGREAIDER